VSGRDIVIEWRGRPATAWLPDPLANQPLEVEAATVRKVERAVAAVQRSRDRLQADWEPPARLLLRAEGLASSNIEGLRAPVAEVAAAELGSPVDDEAAWVADNLAVVDLALAAAGTDSPLRIADLHAWHRRLMRHGPLDDSLIGRLRDRQGWIGGRGPDDAVYVPPPPEHVAALMDDLIVFANRTDLDAVTQAGVLHAQFETIHPYGDGNGRIGRLLIGWVLARRLDVAVPPPTSVLIARDIGGYLAGLHWFRSGEIGRWLGWFGDVVHASGAAAVEWAAEIGEVLTRWRDSLEDLRADAAARRALAVLAGHPVISVARAATLLDVTDTSARNALNTLAERGILMPYVPPSSHPGRPRHLWVAEELIRLVRGWAR
jgi:Fic family protein